MGMFEPVATTCSNFGGRYLLKWAMVAPMWANVWMPMGFRRVPCQVFFRLPKRQRICTIIQSPILSHSKSCNAFSAAIFREKQNIKGVCSKPSANIDESGFRLEFHQWAKYQPPIFPRIVETNRQIFFGSEVCFPLPKQTNLTRPGGQKCYPIAHRLAKIQHVFSGVIMTNERGQKSHSQAEKLKITFLSDNVDKRDLDV